MFEGDYIPIIVVEKTTVQINKIGNYNPSYELELNIGYYKTVLHRSKNFQTILRKRKKVLEMIKGFQ